MRTPDELFRISVDLEIEAYNNTIALMKEHNVTKIMFEDYEELTFFIYNEYYGGRECVAYGVELCNCNGREFLDLLNEEEESVSPYSSEQLFFQLPLYQRVYKYFNKK